VAMPQWSNGLVALIADLIIAKSETTDKTNPITNSYKHKNKSNCQLICFI
jgi:hypothetical protein